MQLEAEEDGLEWWLGEIYPWKHDIEEAYAREQLKTRLGTSACANKSSNASSATPAIADLDDDSEMATGLRRPQAP